MKKISEVRTGLRQRLWLRFEDGMEGTVDLSRLSGQGVFDVWEEAGQFETARIGPDGASVAWGDEVEICADSLYLELTGKRPEELFPKLAVASDA